MEAAVKKQSSFSRSLANDAKMGAYYTDIGMCRRIKNLLSFPEEKEVSCLEPSIGDGKAVMAVTGKEQGAENIKVFGVELNPETYRNNRGNPQIDYLINADFLSGVKISHSAFSFCFANPPYGKDENGERYEKRFVEKLFPYLKGAAVFVLVIPEYVLMDPVFQRSYLARFTPVGAWKFDDEVYASFKQICLIGRKKSALGYLKETLGQWQQALGEPLDYLPKEPVAEPIVVRPSPESGVEYFTSLEFNSDEAEKALQYSPLLCNGIGRKVYAGYCAVELGNPIVPLSRDLCYLVSSVGGGQGYAGTEEDGTLHLQRGKAEVIKTSTIEIDDNGRQYEKEVSHTQITLKVIESDGTILQIK